MSVLYTLLEQARATRARLEAEQTQAVSLFAGAREMLTARIGKLEAAAEEGDSEALATLVRLDQRLKTMREGAS